MIESVMMYYVLDLVYYDRASPASYGGKKPNNAKITREKVTTKTLVGSSPTLSINQYVTVNAHLHRCFLKICLGHLTQQQDWYFFGTCI